MWSGFSSEIETTLKLQRKPNKCCVACGAASRLRLKQLTRHSRRNEEGSRMWSGFSSEIETGAFPYPSGVRYVVACGAASRLRLKQAGWILIIRNGSASHVERLLV